jgi:beta-lactam-binding protein with PASTA domain
MKAISVTTSSRKVTLSGGTGSITANVANQEATAQRVTVAVVPQPALAGPGAAAASTAPSAELNATVERAAREVAPGATEQYLVTFARGRAAPGDHAVKIVAYPSGEAPEEYAAGGQLVELVVEADPAVVPRRKVPWWAIAVIAALVIVVAVVLVVLTRPKQAEVTPKTEVPALVALTKAQAIDLVKGVGLTPNAQTKVGKAPLGVVTSQSPAPGTVVDRGATVTLVVSIGVVPPDQTGRDIATAKAALEQLGLVVVTKVQPSDSAVGTVLAQQPPTGSELGVGETVTLTTASPVLVTVPQLAFTSPTQAITALQALGLSPALISKSCAGLLGIQIPCTHVGSTNPAAGAVVPKGSVVQVIVSSP